MRLITSHILKDPSTPKKEKKIVSEWTVCLISNHKYRVDLASNVRSPPTCDMLRKEWTKIKLSIKYEHSFSNLISWLAQPRTTSYHVKRQLLFFSNACTPYIFFPFILSWKWSNSIKSLNWWLRLHDMLYTLTRPLIREPIGLEVWMHIRAEYSTIMRGDWNSNAWPLVTLAFDTISNN